MTRRNIAIVLANGTRFVVTPEELAAMQGFSVEHDAKRSAWFIRYGYGTKQWYGFFNDPLAGVGTLAEHVRTSPRFRQLMETQQ